MNGRFQVHARKVRTPLTILHNDKNGAVDFTPGIEYFNTLRVPAN